MDFSKALDVKVNEIERPPIAPMGTYVFSISGYSFDTVGDGRFDTVDFQMVAQQAQEDVDPDDLAKVGGVGSVRVTNRFMFNKGDDPESQAAFDRTKFNLKNFLVRSLGLEEKGTLQELIDSAVGQVCLGEITHQPDKNDPEIKYVRLGKTSPV